MAAVIVGRPCVRIGHRGKGNRLILIYRNRWVKLNESIVGRCLWGVAFGDGIVAMEIWPSSNLYSFGTSMVWYGSYGFPPRELCSFVFILFFFEDD